MRSSRARARRRYALAPAPASAPALEMPAHGHQLNAVAMLYPATKLGPGSLCG